MKINHAEVTYGELKGTGMILTFDADKHEYRLGGVKIPSVTQIIADAGLYGDTSHFTEYSRDRGSFVHKAIQLHLSGELDEDTLDPVIVSYLEVWKKFEVEAGYVSDECEAMLADAIYRYAGTVDHIGHLNGHFCIIDVKTGGATPATGIQLAGYENLLKVGGAKRYALHLNAEGSYKLIEYKDRNDRNVFLAALALFYWKQNNNVKG